MNKFERKVVYHRSSIEADKERSSEAVSSLIEGVIEVVKTKAGLS